MKRALTLVLALIIPGLTACGSMPFGSGSDASPSSSTTPASVPFQAPHLSFTAGNAPAGFDKLKHAGDQLLKASGEITVKPSGGVWRLFVAVACSAPTTVSIVAVQSGSPTPVPVLRETPCSTQPSYLGEAVLQGSDDPVTLRVQIPAGQQVWVSSYLRT